METGRIRARKLRNIINRNRESVTYVVVMAVVVVVELAHEQRKKPIIIYQFVINRQKYHLWLKNERRELAVSAEKLVQIGDIGRCRVVVGIHLNQNKIQKIDV